MTPGHTDTGASRCVEVEWVEAEHRECVQLLTRAARPASPSRRDRGRSRLNDGFVDRGAPAARCRRPELGRFVAGGPTWPNGETVLAGLLHVVLLAMALAETGGHGFLAALPAEASRKPRLADRRHHRVVRDPMALAMSSVDSWLFTQSTDASRPSAFPPDSLHGRNRRRVPRAVGGVGLNSAPDTPAQADTNPLGLGLAPVASERGAGVGTVPLPEVARQWLSADPAREARQAVVDPAARQARGVLELD